MTGFFVHQYQNTQDQWLQELDSNTAEQKITGRKVHADLAVGKKF